MKSGSTFYGEQTRAVELTVAGGGRGLLVSLDAVTEARLPEWDLTLQGEACYLQYDVESLLTRAALFRGTRLAAGRFTLAVKRPVEFLEV
ncbi:MAG: hypothetical protein ACYDCO_27930, partial [Armatimonadota bacterium]